MSLFFNLPMVISIGSHGLTSIVFVFRGGLWWWILLSLYPLTSTSVSVSSVWITRGLIGRNVKFHFLSRKTNCIKLLKWRARFWLIDQWFSGFCLRFFRRFLLSTRSRKSLSFYFLSTKASLFFPVIFDQRNIVFNAFDDLVYSTNLLHTQMYPIIELFVSGFM